MDYNKFCYQAEKNEKKSARDRGVKKVKKREIKFRPVIDKNDYEVKRRKIVEFLQQGDRVKITIRFRGREITFQHLGLELMKRLQQDLEPFAVIDQSPQVEGRQMIMVVAPCKKKQDAVHEDS
jgi:translation initiation factor IF-3